MSAPAEAVSVRILDREFMVACAPGERAGLMAAAQHLDARLREMRPSMRTATLERLAILAALNTSHELLTERARATGLAEQIEALGARLEHAFAASIQ